MLIFNDCACHLPVCPAVQMSFLRLVVIERVVAAEDFVGNGARSPHVGLRVVQVGENTCEYIKSKLKRHMVKKFQNGDLKNRNFYLVELLQFPAP